MRVLIACEFSGIVREEFRKLGHDAWSCDLLPTEIKGKHIQGDVVDWINYDWDLMIAHPPCNNLAVSGARYFEEKRKSGEQQKSIDFFMLFVNSPIKRIAIENPIGIMSTIYRKPDQIVQPYMFGHNESKTTCLWLKNLPLLVPTEIVEPDSSGRYSNQTPSGQNKLGPSPDRWKIRSRTYQGLAKAMAEQWSL